MAVAALLGLLVGSFLNVVIWRVPRGESVVSPPSRCPSCGEDVRPRDNIPVLSWLLLRGRCRHCGTRISARYPLVELATAGVFALITAHVGLDWDLPAFLYLAAIGVALTLIDLDVKRLPNAIVLPSYGVVAALLLVPAVAETAWWPYTRALVAMAVLYVVYLALALAYPGGMGFGDVKLAGVLGLYLGWVGWDALAVGVFAPFFLGALVSIVLILARRAGRKTQIPFGPYMIVGAFLALLWGRPLVEAYLSAMTPA